MPFQSTEQQNTSTPPGGSLSSLNADVPPFVPVVAAGLLPGATMEEEQQQQQLQQQQQQQHTYRVAPNYPELMLL